MTVRRFDSSHEIMPAAKRSRPAPIRTRKAAPRVGAATPNLSGAASQLMEANSAARALNIVGDRWALMILGYAFVRVRRFEDFHERIGIARSLLIDRLRRLEDAGVLRRQLYSDHPTRYEYRLTEMGRDLFSPSMMIIRWEKRWFFDKRIAAHRVSHSCGKTFTPECRCRACDGLLPAPAPESTRRKSRERNGDPLSKTPRPNRR